MTLPTLESGMDALLGNPKTIAAVQNYLPSKELAGQAAEATPKLAPLDAIAKIRDEVEQRFDESRVGHLLSQYTLNRDAQMHTLTTLGKDVILSVMAQGLLPAEIAEQLGVSYDAFNEYISITCMPAELKHAEKLAADNLVAEGLKAVREAFDKEDLAKAKALADLNMKIAKAFSSRYTEQKPSTAIQVNNTFGESEEGQGPVPYLQIVHIDKDSLPDLKPHKHKSDTGAAHFTPAGVIEGEVILLDELPEYD